MNINKVDLTGWVARIPETTYGLFSGYTTKFTLLIGKGCEIPIIMVEKDPMKVIETLRKGDKIHISGCLTAYEWFNSYGHRKKEIRVIPSDITIIKPIKREEDDLYD